MNHPALISLLEKISTQDVETFTNFPDIVRAGRFLMNKEDLDYLSAAGYLEERRSDSFGKFFRLTEQANRLLRNKE